MYKQKRWLQFVSLLSLILFMVTTVVSCGGGSSSSPVSTGGVATVTYTNADQAASGGASAKASVDLSNSMSTAAAGLTSSSNPSGYAPGKGPAPVDTTSIASLDPRLKSLVDGMLSRMQSAAVKSAVANANQKAGMAPGTPGTVTISGTCSGGTGTYSVTGNDTSTVDYKEYTVDISLTSCQDVAGTDYSQLTGTIHVYDKEMTDLSSIVRNASVNLTAKKYVANALSKTDVLNGTFDKNDSAILSGRSGMDIANGSFSETDASSGDVGTFYFTNLTNNWSWVSASGVTTRVDTVNGSFGFNATSPGGSITLNIALSNLQNKMRLNLNGSRDQWVNGSIIITWTPDLSLYGCIGGKINFTTPDAAPLHFDTVLSTCPSSGTLQVNNATIVYGTPITVTVGTDVKTFNACTDMGNGGMCQ
jgi:hypothetical protein